MDKAIVPTGHRWDSGALTVTYADGVEFFLEHPHSDRDDRLWTHVRASVDGVVVNHARMDLLDQRARIDFHAVAYARDGRVDWQALMVPLIGLVQQGPPAAPSASTHDPQDPWPKLDSRAMHGLVGKLVLAIDQYTEADPHAVLLNLLTAFGNQIGSKPHFYVEHTKHSLRLFVTEVGETAKGRKGTAWSTPRYVFEKIDQAWAKDCVTAGLSSGEGLINAVRDERWEKQPIRDKGRVVDYQRVMVDEGVADKRLLLVEEEFAQALKVMAREGNILSPILRQAWDAGNLRPLTKTNPIRATNAHISIIAHITKTELLRHLDSTEQTNGAANRFLWAMVRRSKLISNPTGTPDHILNPFVITLQQASTVAAQIGRMQRDADAEELWHEMYMDLSRDQPGLFGAMTARSDVQVLRLAAIYAALDSTALIAPDHLWAALAVWKYCEASVRYIFGDKTGDPIADHILDHLGPGDQLSRTSISDLFERNVEATKIDAAIGRLVTWGRVIDEEMKSGGRGRPPRVVRLTER